MYILARSANALHDFSAVFVPHLSNLEIISYVNERNSDFDLPYSATVSCPKVIIIGMSYVKERDGIF